MKLALGISGDWAPCAPLPIDIVQRGPGVSMHAAAKVDQPRRAADQCCQDVRRKYVDCEHRRVAFGSRIAARLVIDARIVNHRISTADSIELIGD